MSIPDDNVHRQVFGISLIANAIRKIEGDESRLQALAEKRIPELLQERLPGWEVVWGPRVWKYRPDEITTGPDHVFYVAKNKLEFPDEEGKKDTYVLGIAATATPYNWLENNARVDKVVDLYKWLENGISTDPTPLGGIGSTPGSSYIALGTALGVYRLASLASPKTAKSPGVALPAFWASFPKSPDTKVIITGHSLGGALSPTLALGLLESNGFAKFNPKNVLVYPTAGPTAGNLVFAKLFSSRFPKVPGSGYQVWNCNIVNRLDVVSHAWCTSERVSPEQNMNKIPPLYGEPLDIVETGVNGGIFWASLSRTTYMPIQAAWFSGTRPQTAPTNLDEFKAVAEQQHVNEFYKLFNVKITEKDVLTGAGGDFEPITDSEERTEPVVSEIVALIEAGQRKEENLQDYEDYRKLSGDFNTLIEQYQREESLVLNDRSKDFYSTLRPFRNPQPQPPSFLPLALLKFGETKKGEPSKLCSCAPKSVEKLQAELNKVKAECERVKAERDIETLYRRALKQEARRLKEAERAKDQDSASVSSTRVEARDKDCGLSVVRTIGSPTTAPL